MRIVRIVALVAVVNLWGCVAQRTVYRRDPAPPPAAVSYQMFYDELSPYGSWVEDPVYGYVWIPDEGPGFRPYATDGHWVYTDDGWTWDSDYPWGWAAFHYGRWDYSRPYGWFWVPGNEWAPAWVTWRRAPGYYGWAPLRPGVNISVTFGREYREPEERWVFVNDRDMMRPDVSHVYINQTNNITIINNSTVITNTRTDTRRHVTFVAGPDRDDYQRTTHATVPIVRIRDNDRPGTHLGNGELQIYRPQVQTGSVGGQNPAPTRVRSMGDIRSRTPAGGSGVTPSAPRNRDNQPPPAVTPPVQTPPPVIVHPPAVTPPPQTVPPPATTTPRTRGNQNRAPDGAPPRGRMKEKPQNAAPKKDGKRDGKQKGEQPPKQKRERKTEEE